jgi:hypothetical protein
LVKDIALCASLGVVLPFSFEINSTYIHHILLLSFQLPYFIEDLIVTELDLGHNVPLAHRASRPKLDERGLWVDLDVTYEGTVCLTLETKLNLMKVKQMGEEIATAQAMTAAEKEAGSHVGKRSVNLLSHVQHLPSVWILAFTWLTAKDIVMKLDTDVKNCGM